MRDKANKPPEEPGPVYLAKAVLSWVAIAVVTLVVVWILLFVATRGDGLSIGLLVATVVAIVVGAVVRRRRR